MAVRKNTRTTRKTAEEVTDSVLGAEPEDAKTKQVRSSRKAKAVADSAELTVEKVTTSLTKAQLDISKTLGSVRELFESRIEGLNTLDQAIEAKTEELEELHDKEVVAADLRDLVLKRQAFEAEWEKNKNEQRQAWLKEQADNKAAIAERDAQQTKERQQEHEEYEYNTKIARRNDEEAWKQKLTQRVREQKENEEALEKTWREREEVLQKKEAEVAEQKDKLDNFDEFVKKETEKQVAIATNALKSKYENEKKIAQLEFDSEKKLLAHDNNVLKSLVASKDSEIEKLRAALDKKDMEVKEVAVAAMEAQSGKAALAAVQEHAQSQSHGKK
jgi:colicin import membrane protein